MRRPGPAIMLSLVTCAFLTVAPWVAMGIGFMMASRSDPGFAADLSPVRYLASPSPVTLGSWVPMGPEVDLVIRRGDRVASALWYMAVVAASLWFARRNVVAPVERDR